MKQNSDVLFDLSPMCVVSLGAVRSHEKRGVVEVEIEIQIIEFSPGIR